MSSPEPEIVLHHRKQHRKSRQGCKRCKSKKVKCDEIKPTCGGCGKYGIKCEFGPVKQRKPPSPPVPIVVSLKCRSEPTEKLRAMTMNTPSDRLLELRLMHHFTAISAETLFRFIEPWRLRQASSRDVGTRWVVDLALRDEGIMNALFAFSAFNLRRANPQDKQLLCASHKYTTEAIAAHADQVRQGVGSENTESVFAGSLMIAFITVGSRQDISLGREEGLPLNWFQPWQGIRAIVCSSWEHFRTIEIKDILQLELFHTRVLADAATQHTTFDFLLDGLDYSSTDLANITAYRVSIRRLSIMYDFPKRDYVFKFAAKVGPRFVKLLEQNDPRTLTIVGYFFMLLKITEKVWWLPKSTGEEFWRLMELLPEEWKPRMKWAVEEFSRFKDVEE
ncbi:hypothetical protein VTL71DRAFT_3680 [Oculimacula yallundae]|uniref:Zn(2)-C6 fungal-type domain-containing protein n=1 Tax=Oculimacula yallundae TaxID=86028 RepID=A0ABR4C3L7_9HELO